jgi:hypothetical protein
MINICAILLYIYDYYEVVLSFFFTEFNSEHRRSRTNHTRHQILELEKEFHYTK